MAVVLSSGLWGDRSNVKKLSYGSKASLLAIEGLLFLLAGIVRVCGELHGAFSCTASVFLLV